MKKNGGRKSRETVSLNLALSLSSSNASKNLNLLTFAPKSIVPEDMKSFML
jgi:hypothetical protein